MYDTGLNHPVLCESAAHRIPFCSFCHLLVPSRFVDISAREGEAAQSQEPGAEAEEPG